MKAMYLDSICIWLINTSYAHLDPLSFPHFCCADPSRATACRGLDPATVLVDILARAHLVADDVVQRLDLPAGDDHGPVSITEYQLVRQSDTGESVRPFFCWLHVTLTIFLPRPLGHTV